MAEPDGTRGRDLDVLLGGAASEASYWSAETASDADAAVASIRRAAGHRRNVRLTALGSIAVVIAVIATSTTILRSGGDDVDVTVANEPPPFERVASPDDVHASSNEQGAMSIEGLPSEGVAVADDSGVVLVSTRGEVLQRLAGFRIAGDLQPGELVLEGPDGKAYDVDGRRGVMAARPDGPRASERTITLSYGGTLVRHADGSATLTRDGDRLFELPSGIGRAFRVSWDRDIVTRTSAESGPWVAYDLRKDESRSLPFGCHVADRHGPAWYLLCEIDGRGNGASIVRLDADGTTRTLADVTDANVVGWGWADVMVSPDGRTLLASTCGAPTVYFGSASIGRFEPVTATAVTSLPEVGPSTFAPSPLGWSAGGDAILRATGGCSGRSTGPTVVFAFDGEGASPVHAGAPGAMTAMWMPTLERQPAPT